MNKLRENTGVVLWILVFAFGVIWVLQDSGGLDAVGAGASPDGNIAVVDGDPVAYQEFTQAVEGQVRQYEARSGESVTPQVRERIQASTYQGLVDQKLLEREMDRLGITVSDAEVVELVRGENPHPIIKQQFGDGQGGVDRQLLSNFINNPDAKQQWIQIENYIRQQRRQEKLNSVLGAAVHVSEADVAGEYRRRNASADVQYVALPYAQVGDDAIDVTDADLQAFYDENQEDYKRSKTYDVTYVALSKAATAQDTTEVTRELESLRASFEQAANDSLFLARNASETPYRGAFSAPAGMDAGIAEAVYENPQVGRVVGPIYTGGMAHLVKIDSLRPSEQTYARARHILIRDGSREDPAAFLESLKDSLAAGADFAALARRHSDDGSASRGGDLGWFGPDRMVEAFRDAAFGAEPGTIVGPVETQFGQHLIRVEAKADQEAQLADFTLSLRPSIATLNEVEERLGDVAYYASESGDFAGEAASNDLDVQQATVDAENPVVPGLGQSRSIESFLEQSEAGATSEVIELDEQFVVMSVQGVQPEGYRPFEEVQSEIRPQVVREKKQAVQVQKLDEALASGSFEQLPQAVGAEMQTKTNLTFSTRSVPGIGNDAAFIGTALGLSEGGVSQALGGQNAAFVVKTTGVQEPTPITEQQRTQIREQLVQQRRQQLQQQWLTSLRDEAEIDDNRMAYNL